MAAPRETIEAAVAEVAAYCEQRSTDDYRIEHAVRGSSITLLERRPPWNPAYGSEWSSLRSPSCATTTAPVGGGCTHTTAATAGIRESSPPRQRTLRHCSTRSSTITPASSGANPGRSTTAKAVLSVQSALCMCKGYESYEWYTLHLDVARPYAAIAPGVEGEALVVLAGTTAPLTGRQITRLVKRGTSPSVSAALDRLVEQGVVHRQEAGRAYLHTLNRDHIAAPIAELLAGLRTELLRRLREALDEWRPAPLHASMFGSAARADGDASSDIDLLIVRSGDVDEEEPNWRAQVDALGEAVRAWTGNHAGIVELGEGDFDDLSRRPPPILRDLRADAIDLAGRPVRTLLKKHS